MTYGYGYEWPRDKKRGRKSVLVATSLLLIFLLAVAYSQTLAAWVPAPKGYITVGTNTPFQPFEYRSASDQVVGFDMDLAQMVAHKMNVQVRVNDFTDFFAVWPALESGGVDAIISAITITPERSALFDFSIPYYNASQAVLVLKGNGFKCNGNCTAGDFAGFSITYQAQTTSESWLLDNVIGKVQIKGNVSVSDFTVATQLLKTGRVDAIVVDKPVADSMAKNDNALRVAGGIPTGEQYGVVVKKGDPQHILPIINSVISQAIKDGSYKQLVEKWFSK